MPELTGSQPVATVFRSIVTAVGEGRLTPGEAETLSRVLERHICQVELEELLRRVTELEKARASQPAEPAAGATLNWTLDNYAGHAREGTPAAEDPPEDQDRNEADLENQPPQSHAAPSSASTTPETTRQPMNNPIPQTDPSRPSWWSEARWDQPKSR